jgi:hypothetical protein
MVSSGSSPTLDQKPSDEKQIGFNEPLDISVAEAPVILDPSHAAEYVEYLRLKEHFESDPKAYKSLVRRRTSPVLNSPFKFFSLIIRVVDFRIIPMLFLYYLLNSLDSKLFPRPVKENWELMYNRVKRRKCPGRGLFLLVSSYFSKIMRRFTPFSKTRT